MPTLMGAAAAAVAAAGYSYLTLMGAAAAAVAAAGYSYLTLTSLAARPFQLIM